MRGTFGLGLIGEVGDMFFKCLEVKDSQSPGFRFLTHQWIFSIQPCIEIARDGKLPAGLGLFTASFNER